MATAKSIQSARKQLARIQAIKKKKVIVSVGLGGVLLVAGLITATFLLSQSQDLRQQAAGFNTPYLTTTPGTPAAKPTGIPKLGFFATPTPESLIATPTPIRLWKGEQCLTDAQCDTSLTCNLSPRDQALNIVHHLAWQRFMREHPDSQTPEPTPKYGTCVQKPQSI
jgi:hypothetical protein